MQNPNLPHITINIKPADVGSNYQVVELHGDLDQVGLVSIENQLNALIENFPSRYLIFDFSDLNFINSQGIGFLMALHAHLAHLQKSLVIIGAKAHVKDVLSVIGILNVIEVFDKIDDFLKQ